MRILLTAILASALTFVMIGCSGADPAPKVGDAEITKDMPKTQSPPASAAAREQAQPAAPTALPLDK